MEHRHLDTTRWSAAAVDSALERGSLAHWRELFNAVRADPALADTVLRVARHRGSNGASLLASALVERLRPGSNGLRSPQIEPTKEER